MRQVRRAARALEPDAARRGRRLALLDNLAVEMGAGLVATNDVHYHEPERRALQDVVTAILLGCTVDRLGFRRFASAERHLKEPEEMARLFRRHPRAIERTQEIVSRCGFTLDQLTYQYPVAYEGGETPFEFDVTAFMRKHSL